MKRYSTLECKPNCPNCGVGKKGYDYVLFRWGADSDYYKIGDEIEWAPPPPSRRWYHALLPPTLNRGCRDLSEVFVLDPDGGWKCDGCGEEYIAFGVHIVQNQIRGLRFFKECELHSDVLPGRQKDRVKRYLYDVLVDDGTGHLVECDPSGEDL